jgi:hypothetical protein
MGKWTLWDAGISQFHGLKNVASEGLDRWEIGMPYLELHLAYPSESRFRE